jgi:putative mRNA 3-end processing factor
LKLLRLTKRGLYCPQGKFYLDPWAKVDRAIISHGHADHARWGMKRYLCHYDSKNILKQRLGKDIQVDTLGYAQALNINGVEVSFYPAGHVIGSAQIRLEYKGRVEVFSGDYKTQPDFITTPFEPVKCHSFITESTFGLPVYRWKSEALIREALHQWIAYNKSQNRTSVFVGYSLGKAQRIMSLLDGIDEIFVHRSIYNLNEAIVSGGYKIPETRLLTADFNKTEVAGKLIIVPPAVIDSKMYKRIPNAATAICSGWMQIRGNRRWRAVDAGFPVSDHADWDGLIEAVKATEAEEVYVTHGSQATFSRYLNEMGIRAYELKTEYGEEELANSETKTAES